MANLDDLLGVLDRPSLPSNYLGGSRRGMIGRPSEIDKLVMKEAHSLASQKAVDRAVQEYGLEYVEQYHARTGSLPPVKGGSNAAAKAKYRAARNTAPKIPQKAMGRTTAPPISDSIGKASRLATDKRVMGANRAALDKIAAMGRTSPPPISDSIGKASRIATNKRVMDANRAALDALASTPPPISPEIAQAVKAAKAAKEAKATGVTSKLKGLFSKVKDSPITKKLAPAGFLKALPAGYAGGKIGGEIGEAIADWTDGETWYDPALRLGGSVIGGLAGSAATAVPFLGTGLSVLGGVMMAADLFEAAGNLLGSSNPEDQEKGKAMLAEAEKKKKEEETNKVLNARLGAATAGPSQLDMALTALTNSAAADRNITARNLMRQRKNAEVIDPQMRQIMSDIVSR